MLCHSELLGLIEQVIDDGLKEEQCERLEQLLQQPENQAVYCYYMEMHANLHWQARFQSHLDSPITRSSQPICPSDDCGVELPSASRWRISANWRSMALAMGLAGMAFLGTYWAWSRGRLGQGYTVSLSHLGDSGQVALARVTGTMNSRWSGATGQGEFGFDSPLYAGQRIKLTQGLAEVTFSSGVKVVLEAPAELDVAAFNSSFLHSGRMTAMVPDGAEGFEVALKGWTVIDRGTEFGIAASESGKVELHVFKGLVEGHFGDDWGAHQGLVEWHQDTAVAINSAEHSIESLSDSQVKFVRSLSSHSPGNGLLAKEDFEYPPAPLALQNGGFGWGGPWTVLSTQGDASIANAILNESLRYDGLFNAGNRVAISGGFDRARRALSTSIGGVFDNAGFIEDQDGARLIGRDGITIYLSFVQRVNAIGEEFYGLELNRGDGNRNRVLCFGHGAHLAWLEGPPRAPNRELGATGWSVTSEFNGPDKNTLLDIGKLGDESTTTHLIVAKIEFGDANRDKVTVYLDPASLHSESGCQSQVVGYGNFAFDQLSLANFGGFKTFEVDHIRIGKTYEAVTSQSFELQQLASRLP